MRYIQFEKSYSINAGQEIIEDIFYSKNEGLILEYFIRAESDLFDVKIGINEIYRFLNIVDERIPLSIDIKKDDKISLNIKNNDTDTKKILVMLLIQEY